MISATLVKYKNGKQFHFKILWEISVNSVDILQFVDTRVHESTCACKNVGTTLFIIMMYVSPWLVFSIHR